MHVRFEATLSKLKVGMKETAFPAVVREHHHQMSYRELASSHCKGAEGVIKIERKKGTSRGYRFATINVIKPGFRFTLLALPVHKHSEMKGVVEELMKFALKRVKIRRVYCDRWFY